MAGIWSGHGQGKHATPPKTEIRSETGSEFHPDPGVTVFRTWFWPATIALRRRDLWLVLARLVICCSGRACSIELRVRVEGGHPQRL